MWSIIRFNGAICSIVLISASPVWAQSLREAVQSNNAEHVQTLLESGASVNKSYENGMTPIYFATDPAIVDLLLAHGAKLNIRDAASCQSPLENAAERFFRDEEQREQWKAIVGKLRNAGAEYTIDTAIYMNDTKFVRDRLAEDASWINKRRGAQSVPLRLAAQTGRVEICKALLEHKADPDSFERGLGYPVMVDAVKHPAIVRLLIDRGANLKRRITWMGGRSGMWVIGDEGTALHYAIRAGNLESVQLLVAAGLDPNAADAEGQTPLHLALRFEQWSRDWEQDTSVYPKIVEYLLKNDASLRLTDREGRTPDEFAKQIGSPQEIRELLRKAQDERRARFRKAISEDE